MNKHTEKVLAMFLRLDPATERTEALDELRKFMDANVDQRQMLKEAFAVRAGIPLGPTSEGSCPYCGK